MDMNTTPDYDERDTPTHPDFIGRAILMAAVQRQIFSPYSGQVLDVRRAVLIDGTDYQAAGKNAGGKPIGMHVMTSSDWDTAREAFAAAFGNPGEAYDVHDGRLLFG